MPVVRQHCAQGPVTQAQKDGLRTVPDFCASFTRFGGVVRDVQSADESHKNGVNCIRNTLIRAIGCQSVCEAEF